MNTRDKREDIRHRWTFRSVYLLFFVLGIILLYLFYPVPKKKDNDHMLEAISDYTIIFDHHDKILKDVKYVKRQIGDIDLSIKQIQRENDIESKIRKIEMSRNASTLVQPTSYNQISSKLLRMYFNVRQKLAKTAKNNGLVSKKLEECKGYIKDMGRAPF